MTCTDSRKLIRWSGIILVVGGIVVAAGFSLHPYSLYPSNSLSQDVASALWVPAHLVLYLGETLVLFGVIGLFARVVEKSGLLVLVGFVLTIVGGITLAGSTLYSDMIAILFLQSQSPSLINTYNSYLTSTPPTLLAATLGLSLFFGYPLFSVGLVRSRVFPGWSAWLVPLAVAGIAFFIIGSGTRVFYSAGGIMLGLSFTGWGYALVK